MFMAAAGQPVGPMALSEHVAWFMVLSLIVFLVYNGLREESISVAIFRGLRRWAAFAVSTVLLAGLFSLFSTFL
jgi:hypothetical protein